MPDAFDLLDRNLFGALSPADITDSLAASGIYTVSEDVFLFVKRYDRNHDGRLNYSEFQDALMPKSASHATQL